MNHSAIFFTAAFGAILQVQPDFQPALDRAETDREISLLKSLRHHGIVQYLASWIGGDGGTDGSELHIIMEYCENGDLGKYLKKQMNRQL